MPELPEMETYLHQLAPRIGGRTISDVLITREKSINVTPEQFAQAVAGARITALERRAKHLLFHLDSGPVLLLHLMLGGSIFYGTEAQKPQRTTQVVLRFGETALYFIGLRLGYLHLHTPEEAERLLAKLGPEPLSPQFTFERFQSVLAGRKANLKASLVDQTFLSGIGNCYSDEICFAAALLPARRLPDLHPEETSRLYASIGTVLREATRCGGYMDMPLYAGDTLTGGFDPLCRVYDREGEPCPRCGAPIVKDEISSKKSFYCSACQH
ncbi:Fpg/Nei family DNA glycosylase [Paenibacillus athensensis]|uniref:Formamidopyrimidine-DNA glycosylase n=1 Tax=Paenibacillus athensensis TaxID=1967502 RepID=A0A4Y8QAS9_9BACL|nr:DNA-formamidopyrimidine glycosylase family protein [Paenibacillus athensensis]MCD1257467.1 Fpg/Nei family DNA glycosylase [Paenibacillus athensensis]